VLRPFRSSISISGQLIADDRNDGFRMSSKVEAPGLRVNQALRDWSNAMLRGFRSCNNPYLFRDTLKRLLSTEPLPFEKLTQHSEVT
jgi:hypothetical protein